VRFSLSTFAPGLAAFPVRLHEATVSVSGGVEHDALESFAFADRQGSMALQLEQVLHVTTSQTVPVSFH